MIPFGRARSSTSPGCAELAKEPVRSSVVPTDEAPGAYEDGEPIGEAISKTDEVVDRLEIVHDLKAP